jgi:hypothetical protein
VQPFYWEIGDSAGVSASGSVDSTPGSGNAPNADTQMFIASASKLPFAAYVVQKYDSISTYIPYLNFTSGYSNFDNSTCNPQNLPAQTIAQCDTDGNNVINAAEAQNQTFHYEGGHMQHLAAAATADGGLGLGSLDSNGLASEVNSWLGTTFNYVEPQPPGGIEASAAQYRVFLQRLLIGSSSPLKIASMLGDYSRCTQYDSKNCPNAAPPDASNVDLIPDNFDYGLGHWIEDDPQAAPSSNFAYSSAGAHGFYPWVSFDRKWYGILARQSGLTETNGTGAGYASLKCGRLIRQAWITGVEQTGQNPQ